MPSPTSRVPRTSPALLRRVAAAGWTIVALGAEPLSAQQAPRPQPLDSFEAEVARYAYYKGSPSLCKRTDGRVYLARTQDPRALEMLLREYAKPPDEPKDHVKYLIASIVMHFFGETIDDTQLTRWQKRHRKPIDAWMWFESLRKGPWKDQRPRLFEVAEQKRLDPYCRAAAVAAVVRGLSEYAVDIDILAWANAQLAELPTKPLEQALVVEGIAAMLPKKGKLVREDEGWKELCRTVIRRAFDDERSLRRTKVVVASYLARTFDVQNLGFEAVHWNVELDRTPNAKRGPDSGTTSSVGFAGIRTKGDRIGFVIDASDSMLKLITNNPGKADRGPTTGGRSRKAPEKGVVPTADDLDWSRIRTRFDAAREFLRVSLMTLSDDQEFAVVLFGKEATALAATPTLKTATPARIRKVLQELWSLEELPPTRDRPDGRLLGTTNFHGGMRLAFRMTKNGITKKAEFADDKSMLEGCDTIFVLTDGAPTTDDWLLRDRAEPHDNAGDPESGVSQNKTEYLIFAGPYGGPESYDRRNYGYLIDDIQRLNLLRRCEIHCVGIGEADQGLLKQIANIGNGQALKIDERLEQQGGAEK